LLAVWKLLDNDNEGHIKGNQQVSMQPAYTIQSRTCCAHCAKMPPQLCMRAADSEANYLATLN
jgi:hypothetical protein